MKAPKLSFQGFAATAAMLALAPPLAAQQSVKLSSSDTLTISGFVSASLYTNRFVFGGFGQGQNAEWAAQTGPESDVVFTDGEIRNTRIKLGFQGGPLLGRWAPQAVLEADFFAPPDMPPPFQDTQPRLRIRLAYADLSNGRTTVRVGQHWAPLFGLVPMSLTHIAFPLGYGSGGMIGWRYPGVFIYHDLAPNAVQIQLAALRGSGPAIPGYDAVNNIGSGQASGLPQLQARLNLSRKAPKLAMSGYAVGHLAWIDSTGLGQNGDNLRSWAVQAGGSVQPLKLTLQGNVYYGQALGPHFGHITQQGNVRGWGGWAQVGYDFTANWSVWLFYGGEQPDAARFRSDTGFNLLREKNAVTDALLRFRAGRYALGLEYFRADTRWLTGPRTAEQYALSVLYSI